MEPDCTGVISSEVARILTSNGVSFAWRRPTACSCPVTKSLLLRSRRDSAIAIAICSQDERVDLCAVSRLLGWHRARLASPLEVMAYLGPDRDEISPVAADGLPVLVDVALAGCERLVVNGGTRGVYVELSVADLIRLTHGQCAQVALPRWRWE